MTEFIESFATQQLLPPWVAEGARTSCFIIRMAECRVKEYLAKYFNAGYPDRAPYEYSPIPGHQFGMLTTAYFPTISSANKRTMKRLGSNEVSWDHLSHTEVYLAIPVIRHDITPDNILVNPKMVWVQPFLCSDNATAVFSAREIWGSDMTIATIERHEGPEPGQLHVDTAFIGIRKFNPRSVTQLLSCIHIDTGLPVPPDLPGILKASPDLADFVNILGGSGVFAGHKPPGVGPSAYPPGVELDNLKQFRDVHNMGAAIYRAIVSSKASHDNVDNILFYDASKVEIAFMWSDSVAEMLTTLLNVEGPTAKGPPAVHENKGFPPSPDEIDWDLDRVPVKAELAFSFTSDVQFEVNGTLYTYGVTA